MQYHDFEREDDFYQSYSLQKIHPRVRPTLRNVLLYSFLCIAMVLTVVFIVGIIFPAGVTLPVLTSSTLAALILVVLTLLVAFGLLALVCFSTEKR